MGGRFRPGRQEPNGKDQTVRAISWIKTAGLTATIIMVAAAQAQADATPADLQRLQTTLNSPDSNPAQRDDAATALVNLDSPPALAILQNSFQTSDNLPAQLAIARALQQSPNPDTSFIPLLGPAMGANLSLTDAAAQALVNYRNNPNIFPLLTDKLNNMALPDGSRVKIVTAMGNILEQRAAGYLIKVLQDQSNSGPVRAAAANALGEMTGLVDNGQDLQRWEQWWQENQNKPADQWQADLLASRSRESAQIKQRYAGLKAATPNLIRSFYSLTPDDRKKDTLLKFLGADQIPEYRIAGANLVLQDFEDQHAIPPDVVLRLRKMIADSDPEVREAVIDTLGNINDQQAAPDLIAQLGRETDLQTRLEIASALGRMNNLAAVPALIQMLDQSLFAEASAAADALAKLGDRLRQENPAEARAATDALQRIFDTKSTDPAAGDLRPNCVRALAELADPRSMHTFMQTVNNQSETDAVRIAALRGLQQLNNPDALHIITEALSESKPEIQLQAARAMENLAGFAQADLLYGMLAPPTDPRVRDAVWKDLQKIFKTGNSADLNPWPDRFKDDPEKRLIVLQDLRDALQREGKDEQVALYDQDIGATLMELSPKHVDEAVQNFQAALDYWSNKGKDQGGVTTKLDALVGQMLDALLSGQKYQDAADFAAKQLKISPAYEDTVGAKLKNEAQRLKRASDAPHARQLIEAALKIDWPANSHYPTDLKDTLDQLNTPTPHTGG